MTKARLWPSATPLEYCPTRRLPRGIRTFVASKPRTSRLTTARTRPGRSELIAVSRTPVMIVPCGMTRSVDDMRSMPTVSGRACVTRSRNDSFADSFGPAAASLFAAAAASASFSLAVRSTKQRRRSRARRRRHDCRGLHADRRRARDGDRRTGDGRRRRGKHRWRRQVGARRRRSCRGREVAGRGWRPGRAVERRESADAEEGNRADASGHDPARRPARDRRHRPGVRRGERVVGHGVPRGAAPRPRKPCRAGFVSRARGAAAPGSGGRSASLNTCVTSLPLRRTNCGATCSTTR